MFIDPFFLDLLVKERHKDLLKQARFVSQQRINRTRPRVNINLGGILNRIKSVFTPSEAGTIRVIPNEDCIPTPECQVY